MTAMAFAAILVTDRPSDAHTAPRDSRVDQVSALGAASIIVLIAMHVTGIFAAGVLSFTRCMGWPMWQFIESDLHPWLQAVRLGLAGLGAVLVILTVLSALRTELLRRWGIVVAVLFLAEMMLGLLIRTGGLTSSSAAMYSVLAVALLWFLALTTAVAVRDRVRTPRTDSSPVPSEPGLSTPA
jgi:cytochrome c oxidase assembly protein subunit 15